MYELLLKCAATPQVFLFVAIDDLWFRNLGLNSVAVEPTYPWRQLLQEARKTTFLESHDSFRDLIAHKTSARLKALRKVR